MCNSSHISHQVQKKKSPHAPKNQHKMPLRELAFFCQKIHFGQKEKIHPWGGSGSRRGGMGGENLSSSNTLPWKNYSCHLGRALLKLRGTERVGVWAWERNLFAEHCVAALVLYCNLNFDSLQERKAVKQWTTTHKHHQPQDNSYVRTYCISQQITKAASGVHCVPIQMYHHRKIIRFGLWYLLVGVWIHYVQLLVILCDLRQQARQLLRVLRANGPAVPPLSSTPPILFMLD